MKFEILKQNKNLLATMRQVGYRPDPVIRRGKQQGEQSFSRPLMGRPYPRFHIYIEDTSEIWIFKLHLDQKKPSYEGSSAHSGEYEGQTVETEAERIKQVLL